LQQAFVKMLTATYGINSDQFARVNSIMHFIILWGTFITHIVILTHII